MTNEYLFHNVGWVLSCLSIKDEEEQASGGYREVLPFLSQLQRGSLCFIVTLHGHPWETVYGRKFKHKLCVRRCPTVRDDRDVSRELCNAICYLDLFFCLCVCKSFPLRLWNTETEDILRYWNCRVLKSWVTIRYNWQWICEVTVWPIPICF